MSRYERIHPVRRDELPRLAELWEASVRATHRFLTEADIEVFRPLVREGLYDAMELAGVHDENGDLVGFLGVSEGTIEALFIDPEWRGTGLGRRLARHAIEAMGATRVDVNEQNEQALGFWRRMGFQVVARSDRDGMGKPYPLLHMTLADD